MGRTSAAALAILLAAATSAAAQSGPVGYWKGDDGNPTPGGAIDSSGNDNLGTYASGATTSTTVAPLQFTNPTSFSFNGTGANVSVPGFSWPVGGAVTIAYWNHVATATRSSLTSVTSRFWS